MMPGANGAPFDMSKIKEMLEDPSIKDMAKQIAEDPAFKSMAENMQASMAAGGALPGAGAAGRDGQRTEHAAGVIGFGDVQSQLVPVQTYTSGADDGLGVVH